MLQMGPVTDFGFEWVCDCIQVVLCSQWMAHLFLFQFWFPHLKARDGIHQVVFTQLPWAWLMVLRWYK